MPCTERYWSKLLHAWGRAVLPLERRITDFVYKMLVLASRTTKPMQYLGAVLLRPAGVGVGRQRHQGDIEAALAVRRRRWWAAWRGGALTSSCDHTATSSAVLCRSFGVVPQLQFIDSVDGVRDGVLLVLPSVVNRDRYPQGFLFSRVRGVAVH